MQEELKRIISQLKSMQEGPAWHGKSLEEALDSLDYLEASLQPFPGAKSIWELVLHIRAWRRFCIEKVRQNKSYAIEIGGVVDWPAVEEVSPNRWKICREELAQTGKTLQNELSSKLDRLLMETVPGKDDSFYILLHGIVQHDAYHCGQVVLTRKMLAHMQA